MSDELWRQLRVGDRIRVVSLDSLMWGTLHQESKRAYKYLVKRRRPLEIYKVDGDGLPWIKFRFRESNGRMAQHWWAVNHGGLAVVKRRE